MFDRRRFLLAASLFPLAAGEAQAKAARVYAVDGVALGGTDPVGYFRTGAPVRGDRRHRLTWDGAEWLFASRQNRDAFQANPGGYAPQYGGYCAYAVSRGYTASTDPKAWKIVDGRLYLNYSLRVRGIWERDIPGNIRRADANWPSVLLA